jgi:putative ABC transport system permease protein
MFRLALRQVWLDPIRSYLTMTAIAAVIAVILVLRGFEQGLYEQSSAAVIDRGADLFVSQAGVSNFVAVRSSLRQRARRDVEATPGVVEAHPVTSFSVIYEKDGRKVPIYLMVYDTWGGPGDLVGGQLPRSNREAVVDRSLAGKFDLSLGDPLMISEFEFRISGIASNAAAFFMPFVFVTYDGMLDFVLESNIAPDLSAFPLVSHLLVELEPDAEAATVAAAIESSVDDVDVYSPEQMAQNDVRMGKSLFGPIMGLLVSVAYVVGLLVVGLIVYADVRGRTRTFGVLKALGFRLSQLASGVMIQTLIFLVAAFPLGVVLAWGVAECIEFVAPLYRVPIMDAFALARTFAAGIVFGLLGGMLPLRLIAEIDPIMAFKEN